MSKSEQIKKMLLAGKKIKAISIASKFFDKSEDTKVFKQAASAILNPSFYKQIGKDPDEIINTASRILEKRYLCQG